LGTYIGAASQLFLYGEAMSIADTEKYGPQPRKCVIGYITGILGSIRYGERFDSLTPCCDEFKRWFVNTGNQKPGSFNITRGDDDDGLNFGTRGGELRLYLRAKGHESVVNYCHSCGARVEIVKIKTVGLREKKREVSDGYEEVEAIGAQTA
jgi:hypothetical protein